MVFEEYVFVICFVFCFYVNKICVECVCVDVEMDYAYVVRLRVCDIISIFIVFGYDFLSVFIVFFVKYDGIVCEMFCVVCRNVVDFIDGVRIKSDDGVSMYVFCCTYFERGRSVYTYM